MDFSPNVFKDRSAYDLAKKFLISLNIDGINIDVIEKYLTPPKNALKSKTINNIYFRLLESAQSSNMRSGVIGGSIGGVEKFESMLDGFNPSFVIKSFDDWEELLDNIEKKLKPRGKIRRTTKSVWPLFCRSIITGAKFLNQFKTAKDFYKWADSFDMDDRSRIALPLLLSVEVDGISFALGCDFLKEIGYHNFAKPDVHLKQIFPALSLCPSNSNDYQVFKAIVRVSVSVNTTPYDVDKLFWLAGSGYFYDDEHIGNNGRIGRIKGKFIEYAKANLQIN